ncbi:MAG: hypothetical protein V4490_04975 [Pseudomonadota bacterium]
MQRGNSLSQDAATQTPEAENASHQILNRPYVGIGWAADLGRPPAVTYSTGAAAKKSPTPDSVSIQIEPADSDWTGRHTTGSPNSSI